MAAYPIYSGSPTHPATRRPLNSPRDREPISCPVPLRHSHPPGHPRPRATNSPLERFGPWQSTDRSISTDHSRSDSNRARVPGSGGGGGARLQDHLHPDPSPNPKVSRPSAAALLVSLHCSSSSGCFVRSPSRTVPRSARARASYLACDPFHGAVCL